MDYDDVLERARELGAQMAVMEEMRELILSGRADHHAEPWALHRQRGKLEGARLAIEAAAVELERQDGFGEWFEASDNIRALSPAKIVGEPE